ncbi:uncharacterized protein [Amphiura filiformis]|uniref:uncharacterized protein n=1 Tax=Amphiura filiformis TaxID=82378 RepID=UPI003B211076
MSNSSLGTFKVEFLDLDTPSAYDKLIFAPLDEEIEFDVDVLPPDVYLLLSGSHPPRSLIVDDTELQIAWDASIWSTTQLEGGKCGVRTLYLSNDVYTNFTSPGYPSVYYTGLHCQWQIVAEDQMHVVLRIKQFHLERKFDTLTLGNGPDFQQDNIGVLTGEVSVTVISSSEQILWMVMNTDNNEQKSGFVFEVEQVSATKLFDVCGDSEFHCGSGICIIRDAKCNGFQDCIVNRADEQRCAYIECPGYYLCEEVPDVNISQCILKDDLCDGLTQCPGGDDEMECDVKRCPGECSCQYNGNNLETSCTEGWSDRTVSDLARISNALTLSGDIEGVLKQGIFKALWPLETLSLDESNIDTLEKGVFDGLHNLTWLDLSNNNISSLTNWTFQGLPKLEKLYLWNVPLLRILSDAFNGLPFLHTLILIGGMNRKEAVLVAENGFRGLEHLRLLYVDDHHLCCYFDNLDECTTLESQPPLFMCGSLMQNYILRVSMWVLGISALIGNICVVILRIRDNPTSVITAKQRFLVANLAISDCQMGVYMIILASVDLYYGDEYFVHSHQWRSSNLCKFASFLSLLSSEASIFFITLMSIDRFLALCFPFSQVKLRLKSTKIVTAIIWAIAFMLAVIPSLYAGEESELYDLSDVCIGLPLITRPSSYSIESGNIDASNSGLRTFDLPVPEEFKPAWYFSIVIFLGINLVCFLVIFICYLAMFVTVKIARRKIKQVANRDDDIKMAIKMAAIVGTDFICWMPVIIMGILSQTGATVIPLQMYTWSVVFIIPINSSLNPYLYTIASIITDVRKKREAKSGKGTETIKLSKESSSGEASRRLSTRS